MKFIGTYIDETMKWISSKVYAGVSRFGSAVAKFTVGLLVLVTVFWLALSLHLAFVHAFLPVQSHEWPLHLDFNTCLHRPGLCSEPSATIALHDSLTSKLPSPSSPPPPVYASTQPRNKQRDGKHRGKRDEGGKGNWKKEGKKTKEELLAKWQEVLDKEDVASQFPNLLDVSPEEYEAALEQQRLKMLQQLESSYEGELGLEDKYPRPASSCSKPGPGCPDSGSMSATPNLFARGQRYTISVHLEMPDSEANRRLGMFPVEISLLDGHQAPLTTARRPVLLPYRSSEQKFVWSLLQAPTLLFRDSYPETYELELVLYDSFIDDPLQPAKFVSVTMRSRFVQVSSCRVSVVASFSGLRRLLHRYPLLSAAVGTLTNMVLLLAAVTVCWLRRTEKSNPLTRLPSARLTHSNQRTASLAVTDVTGGCSRRGKLEEDPLEDEELEEDLLEDDKLEKKAGKRPQMSASQRTSRPLASLTDVSADQNKGDQKGGVCFMSGSSGSTERLSVLPEDALMSLSKRGSKVEELDLEDKLHYSSVTAALTKGDASVSPSLESLSSRSSKDHTDDEFTLLNLQGNSGAALRQRATAEPLNQDDAAPH